MPSESDLGYLEQGGLALQRLLLGASAGAGESVSGVDKKVANAIMLAGGAEASGLPAAERYWRSRSENIAAEVARQNAAVGPSAAYTVGRVAGRIPVGTLESVAAARTGGPIAGFGGLAALEAADQGPAAAAVAGGKGALTGAVWKLLEPYHYAARALGVGASSFGLSDSQDPVERTADAIAQGIGAALPNGRIGVEVSRDAPVRIEGQPAPLPAKYALVDASSLKPSHDARTFAPRPDYGGVQERDYQTSKNEQSKVIGMADSLDPRELLSRVPNANSGPPVVDSGGNVWGGNGRTMAVDRIYGGDAKTDPASLKKAVVKAAPSFGLDAKAAAALERPMVVRVLEDAVVPTTREGGLNLSRELNVETTHAATPGARAQSNAAALDQGLTVFADAAHTTGEDVGTVRSVLESGPVGRRFAEALQADGVIPPSERARWLTDEGTLTKHGLDQAEAMLLARVLPDQRLIDSAPAELREKVLRNVPAILSVERSAPQSLAPLIEGAVRSEVARAATGEGGKKLSVDEFNAQLSLDPSQGAPSQRDPRVAAVQSLLAGKKASELRSVFRSMNERVGAAASGQADLLTGKVASPQQAVDEVLGVVGGAPQVRPGNAQNMRRNIPAEPSAAPALESAAQPAPAPTPVPAVQPEPAIAAPAPGPAAPAPFVYGRHTSDGTPILPDKAELAAMRAAAASTPPPLEPPLPPPRAGRRPPPEPPPPPEPTYSTPPSGPAEYYKRVSELQAHRLAKARRLAKAAKAEAIAPFKLSEGTILHRPIERRAEEVRAVLDEILARQGTFDPKAAVDELLTRPDVTLADHADVVMPTIARFYRDHAYIAKRGVVPDVELRGLASELGMSEDQVLRRMVGETPNAETVVAMHQLVASRQRALVEQARELENPATRTEAGLARFAANHKMLGLLWAQYRGARGELGRAMRAVQLAASAERTGGSRQMSEAQLDSLFDETYGGKHNLVNIIDKMNRLEPWPDSQKQFSWKTTEASTWQKIMTAWRSSLMSGGATVTRNIFGNFILQPAYLVSREVGAVAGRMIDLLPTARIRIPIGKNTDLVNIGVQKHTSERAQDAQAYQELVGMISAGRAAVRLWRDTLIGPAPEGGRTVGNVLKGAFLENRPPVEDPSVPRGQRFKNENVDALVATPFRINEAFDVGARYPAVVGRLSALAYREVRKQGLSDPAQAREFMNRFIGVPPKWAWEEAWAHGQRQTLNEDLGPKGQAIVNLVRRIPVLGVAAPFLKIPINLTRELGRYGPAGGFMSDVREQLAAGGAARDEAIGKMTVGTAMGALSVYLANQGTITGSGPTDPARRKLWMAQGHRPYSIEYTDANGNLVTHSYRGFEPASSLLGVYADLGEKWHELSASEQALTPGLLVSSMVRNVDDIPVMTGISDALESLASGDPKQINRWLVKLGTSAVVPRIAEAGVAGVRLAARYAMDAGDDPRFRPDPFLRQSRDILDSVMQRAGLGNVPAPGRARAAPPRTDFWGQDLRKDETVGPTYLSPFKTSTTAPDPVTNEMFDLVKAGAMAVPGDLSNTIGSVELDEYQARELKRGARGRAHATLASLIQTPQWEQIGKIQDPAVRDYFKRKLFERTFELSAEIARAQMVGAFSNADKIRASMSDELARLLHLEDVP